MLTAAQGSCFHREASMAANLKPVGDSRPPEAFPPTEPAFLNGAAAPDATPGAAPSAMPFLGESQREAAAVIRSALAKRNVFAALTGETGLGKTLLLDAVIAQPGMPVRVFRLGNPSQVSAAQVAQIERALAQPAPGGRHTALFVDDAHAASEELLRFLAGVAADGRGAPQVILAGRPALWDRLASPALAPLLERIGLRTVLRPFTTADARGLVKHLLDQPRRSGQMLTAEAEAEVLRFGAGLPDRIAQVLGGTLQLGDVQTRLPVPAGMVRSTVAMLAGRQQPGRRRHVGAWAAGVIALAAVGTGAVAMRGWPPAVHGWTPDLGTWASTVRDWTPDRVLAALGLARLDTLEQARMSGPAPQALPLTAPGFLPPAPPAPVTPDPPADAEALASAPLATDALPQPLETPSNLPPPPSSTSPGLQPPRLGGTPAPLSPSTVALLLRQGNERLALGDISAARRLFERAAAAGSAAGARGVARTYDPSVLGQAGMLADPAAAAAWQRVAAALGEAEARRDGR